MMSSTLLEQTRSRHE
ncbi:BnaA07g37690D [Brassica napus]|uniref:BnaA07g37690D protein n=1 Tax=Brassica napus TaxID=3708 RepID=A0A078ITJ9_BRANA|nr:BnaA07g37690D [Brassica napus]